MRGIMTFDDYNYKSFNEYMLMEEPKEYLGLKNKQKSQSQQPQIMPLNQKLEIKKETIENVNPEPLVHDLISIPPSDYEIECEQQKAAELLAKAADLEKFKNSSPL